MSIAIDVVVLTDVINGELSIEEAAAQLGCSSRTVWRKAARFREKGEEGLVHGLRGRRSNRAMPEHLQQEVARLYREQHRGFSLIRFTHDLALEHSIQVSRETVRRWLIADGIWQIRGESEERTQP